MISKQKFTEIINRLKETDEVVNKVNELFRNTRDSIRTDFMNASAMSISHEEIVGELLDDMFDTDIISYWLWELDYGRKYEDGCITHEKNGKIEIIDISTPEKIYDYLTIERND